MECAVLDANILYPAMTRDFFMRLAVKLYQPKWTDAIHEEWIRNLLADRPDLTLTQLTRTRELMDRHGGLCQVTGYEDLIPALTLPDPDDRHVLAAAIQSQSAWIVTFNLSDFPAEALAPYNVRALHPDDFALRLYETESDTFVSLIRLHRQALSSPLKSPEEYLITLAECGLKRIALLLEMHREEI